MKPGIIAIIIALASVLIAFGVNEANLFHLQNEGKALRDGECVITNDDVSYLSPFDKLRTTGHIYTNEVEKYSSVIRSPGYGFIFYLNALIFGREHALLAQKILQLLLFGLSIYCFFFISFYLFAKKSWAVGVSLVYAVLPFSMGFLYYTLTEAITPALSIIFIFFLIRASRNNDGAIKLLLYLAAALVLSYLLLTRPVLALIGSAFPFFLWKDLIKRYKVFKTAALIVVAGTISLAPLAGWQIRNTVVLGRTPTLLPIYQNEIPGIFRKPLLSVWGLYRAWEDRGARFHESMVPFWNRTMAGDTSSTVINDVINAMPEKAVQFFGTERMKTAFKSYQIAIRAQAPYYNENRIMPSVLLPEEKQASQNFDQMAHAYERSFWFEYHVLTPLKVFKNMAFHSNLSLYMFQHTYRGYMWMEALRWICFIIHSLAFVLSLLFIFTRSELRYKIIFGLSLILYYVLLCYFQRGIEERYTLPLLPFILISASFVIKYFLSLRRIQKNAAEEQPEKM